MAQRGRKSTNKPKDNFAIFKAKQKTKSDVIFDKTFQSFKHKVERIIEDDLKPVVKKVVPEKKVEAPKVTEFKANTSEPMKLNKFIAHCGICSRRAAGDLVKKGTVKVNGKVEINPSYTVLETDLVEYDGKALKQEENKVYFLMNKPKNTITSSSDEKGRKTVLDIVKNKIKERVYPVGRLDRNTTGLLLLTNDGDLATSLAHPSTMIKKVYLAELDKPMRPNELEKIREGLMLEDGKAEVDDAQYNDNNKQEIIVTLHSGKNRIVRRIFEHLGFEVVKLDRLIFAGLTKKDLPRGFFRPLTKEEVIFLKHFTKMKKK